MSAPSGIEVTDQLRDAFSAAVESKQTRFIKVSIEKESLVHSASIPIGGSLLEDLQLLASDEILEENTPAYLLTKLDDSAEWLVIYYVPDTAKVREKMLYASSRASLLKSLGSSTFSDSIFATSKADLTPDAYAAHRKHVLAPKPLSSAEQEMADIRAAERLAGGLSAYQGSRARTTHIGQTVGMGWTEDVQEAVKALGDGDESVLVVSTIDMSSETVVLQSSSPVSADALGAALPPDTACYAFFAWKHSPSQREIIFIYSCPSGSPVKQRMVYATGFNGVYMTAKTLLEGASTPLHSRKIETSNPGEINEAFLRSELDFTGSAGGSAPASGTQTPAGGLEEQKKPFAKPRGPKRR
ncbi:Protein tyrosine kinase [Mycena chlorophos]|uniref:Protein tyrosine kinase n=1 Tax=Mycena chlorophos TaxID=658473 RepID=A0A8H6TRE4_MYCCL|nr:Protein tyrosine kinase [Mycena chlorophos]